MHRLMSQLYESWDRHSLSLIQENLPLNTSLKEQPRGLTVSRKHWQTQA